MGKSKKEKIIASIGFVVLLAVLTVTLTLFFKPNNPMDYADTRMARGYKVYDEPNNTLDVLFFGHSSVYTSISPMEMYDKYGFTSYDCSYALQMPWETAEFLKEVLTKQSPKVVVMDIDSLFYDIKRTDIKQFYDDAVNKKKNPLSQNHIAWRDWFPDLQMRDRDVNKGYTIYKNKKPYKGTRAFKETEKRFAANEEMVKGLDDVVKICQEKNIVLFLVELPNKTRWTYEKFNTASDYAKEHGLLFTDFTQEEKKIGIDWTSDTMDEGDHLNYYGAVKLNEYLGKILKEKYDLPDRRNYEKYAFWKDDLEQYKKNCGK